MRPLFTPGPWYVTSHRVGHRQRQRAIYGAIAPGHYPSGVLAHTMGSRLPEMNDANAHLIAAAPELYEALETITELTEHEDYGTFRRECQRISSAVLAKARGEQ